MPIHNYIWCNDFFPKQIDLYTNFGATEHFCLRNDDNSVHVARVGNKWCNFSFTRNNANN